MKKIAPILIILFSLSFTSCVVVDNTPGPNGRDGLAYFGIDFEHKPPYSYWDNNKSIPYNPAFGTYYHTYPGVYEFEYFINPREYWYGTYEVYINYGGIGGPHGEPGYDGLDTYLMLITDPHGFHTHENGYGYKSANAEEPLVVEKNEGKYNYKITIQKGNIENRQAQSPKYMIK
ncbi:MAG: hypothetical protein J5I47_05635 [Vicingus serpentipes]|nr:hypothetical protein [Vicingus serpentipes]